MHLGEYQTLTSETAVYPNRGNNIIYPLLGQIGELGELIKKVKDAVDRGDILIDCPAANVILRVLDVTAATGETAELLKKSIRAGVIPCKSEVTVRVDKNALGNELGDGLWYQGQTAFELGFSLEEVGEKNVTKVHDRLARGVIEGNGDNR